MDTIIVLFGVFSSTVSINIPGHPPDGHYDVAVGGQNSDFGLACEILDQLFQSNPALERDVLQLLTHPNEVGHPVVDLIDCTPGPSGRTRLPRSREIDQLWKELNKLVTEFDKNMHRLNSLSEECELALHTMRMAMDTGVCAPMTARQDRMLPERPTLVLRFPNMQVLIDQIKSVKDMGEKYETIMYDFVLNKSDVEHEQKNAHSNQENDPNARNLSPTRYTKDKLLRNLRKSIKELNDLNQQARNLIRLFSRNLERMLGSPRDSTASI